MAAVYATRQARRVQLFAKRTFDVIVAAATLILLSPLFLLTLLVIKLDSRGPIFSTTRQHCYGDRVIDLMTFRCSETTIGASLRRSGLERLPVWINVLRGEMSVIGPRCEAALHSIPFPDGIALRDSPFKPGIITPDTVQAHGALGSEGVNPDVFYIANWSLLLDLRIFFVRFFSLASYIDKN
jgi:lipopolysaccharide/colanic/teichoic acid biosynthesis glycosyltransferase